MLHTPCLQPLAGVSSSSRTETKNSRLGLGNEAPTHHVHIVRVESPQKQYDVAADLVKNHLATKVNKELPEKSSLVQKFLPAK